MIEHDSFSFHRRRSRINDFYPKAQTQKVNIFHYSSKRTRERERNSLHFIHFQRFGTLTVFPIACVIYSNLVLCACPQPNGGLDTLKLVNVQNACDALLIKETREKHLEMTRIAYSCFHSSALFIHTQLASI